MGEKRFRTAEQLTGNAKTPASVRHVFGTIPAGAALCFALAVAAIAPPVGASRERTPGSGLPGIAFGALPPDFGFDVGTGAMRLRELVGRPVVISFWATWCEPCIDEMPAFAALGHVYGARVALVTVSDQPSNVTAPFLTQHDVSAMDVADPARRIFELYGVRPIPITLVLDRDGLVRHVSVGELAWPELDAAVRAAAGADPLPLESATPGPTPT